MFRFSGLLVAVALVLVAQEAQAQDTSQHIAGGGRAQAFTTGELWSVSVAADIETDGSASGHLRLRSGGGEVYDIPIIYGQHLGDRAFLGGTGADGTFYTIEITEESVALFTIFGGVDGFSLQRGHIGL